MSPIPGSEGRGGLSLALKKKKDLSDLKSSWYSTTQKEDPDDDQGMH